MALSKALAMKFLVLVNLINREILNDKGHFVPKNGSSFKLYIKGDIQSFHFSYDRKNLTITWKYRTLQKKLNVKKTFNNVRSLTYDAEQNIAVTMCNEVRNELLKNKLN